MHQHKILREKKNNEHKEMRPPKATLTHSYIESSAAAVPVAAAANHRNKNAFSKKCIHSLGWANV